VTLVPQTLTARSAPNKGELAVDPVLRQIRDLVYKVSGIYKAEDKLYLLADGCGRRMKQLSGLRASIGTISPCNLSAMGSFGNC